MTDLSYLSGQVTQALKETYEYGEYRRLLEAMRANGPVYDRVREFREKNFFIQQQASDDMLDLLDALTNEYEDVINMELVNDFIEAEAAFCRLIQDFNTAIIDNLEFDI